MNMQLASIESFSWPYEGPSRDALSPFGKYRAYMDTETISALLFQYDGQSRSNRHFTM